jgi:hypothetical protein
MVLFPVEHGVVHVEHGLVPVEHGVVHVEHGVVSVEHGVVSCTLCSKILFFGVIIFLFLHLYVDCI